MTLPSDPKTPLTLATDLDRTLFPNGTQPDDGAMPLFRRLIEEKAIPLVFVTGRNRRQIEDGIRRYGAPAPDFAIAEVGTKLYRRTPGGFEEDRAFVDHISEQTRNWDTGAFRDALRSLPLRLQPEEHQNRFKLSFYVDDLDGAETTRAEVETRLRKLSPDTTVIWSVDETEGVGLLDVLPRKANKMEALEYLRGQLATPLENLIYCGDSGNDLLPLTHGYRAILVANAIDEVRSEVKKTAEEKGLTDRTYFARGDETLALNGNYVSGILEGLRHFGAIGQDEWRTLTRSSEQR